MATTPAPALAELLTAAARHLRRRWSAQLEPWDIAPHQARALRLIARETSTRPGRVADELRIAARSASDVIDALERRGLVTRGPDPTDRRAVVVAPTAAGARLATELDAARRLEGAAYFEVLSERDQRQLARILRLLVEPGDRPVNRRTGP